MTKKCAVTTAPADHVFERASRKMSFLAMRGSLATKQKDIFFKAQREFQACHNNQTLQGTLHGTTNNEFSKGMGMHFAMVVRGMFLSRQRVQQVHVNGVLALLPCCERCLQMMENLSCPFAHQTSSRMPTLVVTEVDASSDEEDEQPMDVRSHTCHPARIVTQSDVVGSVRS
jgi:hypothetical protein